VGETSYDIYRWNGATSAWVAIGHPAVNATSFTDTGLSAGTTYYHYVCATNASGSTCSASYVTTTTLSGAKPSAPTGVSATPLSSTSIRINWTDSTGETSYDVYRWNSATAAWVVIAHPAAGSTQYTDPSLASGTTYYHYVCATNANGSTCAANYTTATTP
jgi:fibronectin type 3 domain-containing protein